MEARAFVFSRDLVRDGEVVLQTIVVIAESENEATEAVKVELVDAGGGSPAADAAFSNEAGWVVDDRTASGVVLHAITHR